MGHTQLDQSRDCEADRRASPPVPDYSTGALLTTAFSLQGGIRAAACPWRRTAATPQKVTGSPVVHCFHLLMYLPLSAVINTSHRLCRRHPRPGGSASPDPPKRYADVACSGEAPLAYGIPIAISPTNAISTSATMILYTEASGELLAFRMTQRTAHPIVLSGGRRGVFDHLRLARSQSRVDLWFKWTRLRITRTFTQSPTFGIYHYHHFFHHCFSETNPR